MKKTTTIIIALFFCLGFIYDVHAELNPLYKSLELKGYTADGFNDNGQVLLHKKEQYYIYSPDQGLHPIEEIPHLTFRQSPSIIKFTNSGIILGQYKMLPSEDVYNKDFCCCSSIDDAIFVYYPDHGYINLYHEMQKIVPEGGGQAQLCGFEALDVTETGIVIGKISIAWTNEFYQEAIDIFWTYDSHKGIVFLDFYPDDIFFKDIFPNDIDFKAINNNGQILFLNQKNSDYILFDQAGKIVHLHDLGLINYLNRYIASDALLDSRFNRHTIIQNFTDDGVIAGTILDGIAFEAGTPFDEFYPDGSLVFLYYPDGSLYISGISEYKQRGEDLLAYDWPAEGPDLFYANNVVLHDNNFAFITGTIIWPIFISDGQEAGMLRKIPRPSEFIDDQSEHGIRFFNFFDCRFNTNGDIQVIGIADETRTFQKSLFLWDEKNGVQFLTDLHLNDVTSYDIKINAEGDILCMDQEPFFEGVTRIVKDEEELKTCEEGIRCMTRDVFEEELENHSMVRIFYNMSINAGHQQQTRAPK